MKFSRLNTRIRGYELSRKCSKHISSNLLVTLDGY